MRGTVQTKIVGQLTLDMTVVRMDNVLLVVDDLQAAAELDKFHMPAAVRGDPVRRPVNTLGIRRIMLAVDDIDDVLGW